MKQIFSASVFVTADSGAVLLIHHLWHKMWLPPGGSLEEGETPLDAAIRELREETGLVDVIFPIMRGEPHGTPPGFLGYEEHPGKNGMHLNFCFIARVPEPVSIRTQTAPQEYDAYDWFLMGRGISGHIAKPVPPNVRDVLLYIDNCMTTGSGRRDVFP